jgi:HlyD family secretion protein
MVQPVNEVKISPDVSGEIIELHIEEGDSVQKGQLLLKIRPDIYQSYLDRALANLNQQKANLANSQSQLQSSKAQFIKDSLDFARNERLYKDSVISAADYQLSRANFEVSQSNFQASHESVKAARYIVKSGEAAVNEARENLRFTNIISPVTGTVSKLNIELGERVVGTATMSGTEMLRIANLTNMEARVDVNENDIIRVSLGDSAVIDVDAYSSQKRKFKGVVTQIANTANDKMSADAVTEFEVRIKILNESYEDLLKNTESVSPFRPGMTASVEIISDVKADVLSVPLAAVTTREKNDDKKEQDSDEETDNSESSEEKDKTKSEEKQEIVFVFENGTAKKVNVETGISDFDNIEIISGVTENQEIISGPFVLVSKKLKDGDLVKKSSEEKEDKKE